MAKALKIVGLAVAAIGIGLVTAGFGAVAFTGAITATISTTAIIAVGAAIEVGAGLLAKKGSTTTSQTDRLTTSIDPRTARKSAYGHTALNNDLRYEEWFGSEQEYCACIIALASHKIESLDEIWVNQDQVWTLAGGVAAKYNNYVIVQTIAKEGSPSIIANWSPNAGKWNSSSRLTGCAYVCIIFRVTGYGKNATSPFNGGLPSRITFIGRGGMMYDPRRDSTVPGGNGPMRAGDQSTWRYVADDGAEIGANIPLMILRELLGWRITNPVTGAQKLAVGGGLPPRRIDMASFIVAANIADELANVSAGGTEPKFHGGACVSEGDDLHARLDMFCAACNGRLREVNGKLALVIMHNDLPGAAADDGLNDDDVIGAFTWESDPPLDQCLNVVRGKWTDPSPTSLFQMIDYPEVRLDSLDGIDRTMTLDLSVAQSASHAQRVAKQVLERRQYQRTFSAPFDIRAWKYQLGDVVPFTFSALSFDRRLMRVASQELGQDGQCVMTLMDENEAIYAWDADDAPAVTAAAPVVYDPTKSPLILGIANAATSANWSGVIDDNLRRPTDYADRTLVNTAAGITGQGSLATLSGLAYGGPYLFGFGQFAALSTLGFGSPLLTGFGLLAGLPSISFGSPYLLTSGGGRATDAAYQTALGTASGFLGQSPWATLTASVNRVSNIDENGIMTAGAVYQPGAGFLSTYFPATLGADKTGNATAAGFFGQGVLATRNQVTASLQPYQAKDNLIPDGAFADDAWWRGSYTNMYTEQVPGDADNRGFWTVAARRLVITSGDFDRFTDFFAVEPGATYRVDVRLYCGSDFQGWASPVIHMPNAQWFSLATGQGIADPYQQANAQLTTPNQTVNTSYVVKTPAGGAVAWNQWQFRLRGIITVGAFLMQVRITRIMQLGTGVTRQDGSTILTDGAAVTSLGIASGFSGQSPWATYTGLNPGTVYGQVQNLQTDGYFNSQFVYKSNVGFLSDFFPATTGADKTSGATSAGISGQGALATANGVDLANGGQVYNRYAEYLYYGATSQTVAQLRPAEFGSNVTEGRTAAAITGQGPWATTATSVDSVTRPATNLMPYPRPVAGSSLQAIGWQGPFGDTAGVAFGSNDYSAFGGLSYYMVRNGSYPAGTPYCVYDIPIAADGSTYTVSLFQRIVNGGQAGSVQIINAAKSAGISGLQLSQITSADGNGMARWSGTVTNAQGQDGQYGAFLRLVVAANWNATSGYQDTYWHSIKAEPGSAATQYSDASRLGISSRSLTYDGGTTGEALRPGEGGANRTEGRTAAAVAGQGALATLSGVDLANSGQVYNRYAEYLYYGATSQTVASLRPQEGGANVTEGRTAAAFTGQGAFATQSYLSLSDTRYFLATDRFGTLDNGDPRYFNASVIQYGSTSLGYYQSLQSLKPQEAGSNVTEGRTAAAITGQSQLATAPFGLNQYGAIDARNIDSPQYAGRLSDYFPQESGANRTEGRTAAAIAGQSQLATAPFGLNPAGAIESNNIDNYGVGRLSTFWPQDVGSNRTENRTAAAITGQGAFATAPQIGSWNVASYYNFSAFQLGYSITRSDGVSTVTEALVVTQLGASAGFVGQGALATRSDVGTGQIQAGAVTGFYDVPFGVFSLEAGSEQVDLHISTSGGRLRVEISFNPTRSGGPVTSARVDLAVFDSGGGYYNGIGHTVNCPPGGATTPPVYYSAWINVPAGDWIIRATFQGDANWYISDGELAALEVKR